MGTYTTNYNLFMPSVGEQGWGDLVNGNFTTIDTTMKSLNTQVGTLEIKTDVMKEKLDVIDVVNGAIDGKFIGDVDGALCVNLSSTPNSIIGTYDVVGDDTHNTSTITSVTKGVFGNSYITIADITLALKKGFKCAELSPVPVTFKITESYTGSNIGSKYYMYIGGVKVSEVTRPNFSNNTNSTTTQLSVSKGDVVTVKVYIPDNYNGLTSNKTLTLDLATGTGSLYLA